MPGTRMIGNIQVTGSYAEAAELDEVRPQSPGAAGQIIQLDPNGEPIWVVPSSGIAVDGNYPQMRVGTADNLAGRDSVGALFTRRTTGGSASVASGRAIIERIKGRTIKWQQEVDQSVSTSGEVNGITFLKNADGSWILNGTATENINKAFGRINTIAGHKYAIILQRPVGSNIKTQANTTSDSGLITTEDAITTMQKTFTNAVAFNIWSGVTLSNVKVWPQIFDLTDMGISDIISTPADLTSLFPLPYYPHLAEPKLLNFNGTGILTDGFNQIDLDALCAGKSGLTKGADGWSGTIANWAVAFNDVSLTPLWKNGLGYNGQMCIFSTAKVSTTATPRVKVRYADDTTETISPFNNTTSFADAYAATTIGKMVEKLCFDYGTGGSAILTIQRLCINLSWSGIRNGQYEEYWQEIKQLPSLANFTKTYTGADGQTHTRVGMDGIGDAYDEMTESKDVKRFGVVDLGTLNWDAQVIGTFYNFRSSNIPIRLVPNTAVANIICKNYTSVSTNVIGGSALSFDKTVSLRDGAVAGLRVRDDSFNGDAATFKAAMAGVLLIYELDTPVEVTLPAPRNLSYKEDDYGTESLNPQGVGDDGTPLTTPFIGDIIYPFRTQKQVVKESSIPAAGMEPNVFYDLGTISSNLTVALQAGDPAVYNEYMLQFSIGATVPSAISFPNTVKFQSTPTFEANKTYQISIVENLGVVSSWSNS